MASTPHVIAGKECEKCEYGILYQDNRNRLKVYCDRKDREYFYGARIPCEDFSANESDSNENEEDD